VPSPAVAASAPTQEFRAGDRPVLPLAVFFLALGTLWFVVCKHLGAEWSYNEQYNYGWFVPFFALYLFWLRWEDRPQPEVRGQRSRLRPASARQAEVSLRPRGAYAPAGGQRSDVSGERTAFENRKSRIENRKRGLIASAIAIPALLLLLPLRLIEGANPDWRPISWLHAIVAVLLTLVVIWYAGGKPWLRHFAFPVMFVLVAVPWLTPIEGPIIQRLMPIVASIATEILSLFGIPAEVQGNLIRINDGMVGVNEACSGVRSLQTSIMIGLLFGELKRLRIGPRVLLVAAAIAIACVANCGRAFFVVWIAAKRGIPEVEHWHNTAGYAIVALAFLGCLVVTAILSRGQRTEDSGQRSEDRDQRTEIREESTRISSQRSVAESRSSNFELPRFFVLGALAWLLLVELGTEAWYRAHERNLRPSAQWNVHWPESAPDFREVKIDERTRTILHNDEGRGATWRDPKQVSDFPTTATGDAMCLLYFFRWHPGHNSALLANAHRPDVCLPASGWRQTGDFGVRTYQVTRDFAVPFRHFEFSSESPGRKRIAHAFYCVWEDRVAKDQPGTESRGLSGDPSSWTRSERIQAVLNGRRHLGQQVMEYLRLEPREISASEAEQTFAASVRQLILPASPSS